MSTAAAPAPIQTTTTSATPTTAPAPPQRHPAASAFTQVVMPKNHLVLAGEKYYTLRQVSDHTGMSSHNLNRLCNAGQIQFIIKPLTRNGQAGTGTKLVHEAEVRRILSR